MYSSEVRNFSMDRDRTTIFILCVGEMTRVLWTQEAPSPRPVEVVEESTDKGKRGEGIVRIH